jgi:nickel-dependent lactate racemase
VDDPDSIQGWNLLKSKEKGMEKPFLRYKGEKRFFEVLKDWKVLTLAAFQDHQGEKDVEPLTRQALDNPIGAPPLKECVSSSDKVAILIEDQTRASPKRRILKILLEELGRAQVPKENISIIVSLGTHRALTAEELKDNYGEEVVQQYSIHNHDCQAPDLVPVAKLKTGTVVKINKRVHDATFKIGIGSIFPHPMNGFGGGCKILFPGVSNFDAILEHHLKYSFRGNSKLGILGGNPFYEEVSAIAKGAGLNFILNSVLDHNDHLYDLVGGDPVEAHQKGSDICKEIVSRTFQKKADLTVTSAFPYTEGLQIMKPLAPTSMITKEGGCIILLAHCTSPLPEDYLKACERIRQEYNSNLRESILRLFDKNERLLEGSSPEYNMSMTQALLGQDSFNVILVTEDIPRDNVERLGFHYAQDLDQAFSMSASINSAPEVHIIPSGGVILPTLENE